MRILRNQHACFWENFLNPLLATDASPKMQHGACVFDADDVQNIFFFLRDTEVNKPETDTGTSAEVFIEIISIINISKIHRIFMRK